MAAACMVRSLTVRRAAAVLTVHASTAFRWRHRLLASLQGAAGPAFTGDVVTGECYIRYSEKGSWYTNGPGARGLGEPKKRFRRFKDGKASCVAITCAGDEHIAEEISSGRPTALGLAEYLKGRLGPEAAAVYAEKAFDYEEASQHLPVPFRTAWSRENPPAIRLLCYELDRVRERLYRWFAHFHGVATRYLVNYLVWFCRFRLAGSRPQPIRRDPRMKPVDHVA